MSPRHGRGDHAALVFDSGTMYSFYDWTRLRLVYDSSINRSSKSTKGNPLVLIGEVHGRDGSSPSHPFTIRSRSTDLRTSGPPVSGLRSSDLRTSGPPVSRPRSSGLQTSVFRPPDLGLRTSVSGPRSSDLSPETVSPRPQSQITSKVLYRTRPRPRPRPRPINY